MMERKKSLIEVSNTEKQLMAVICSNDILHGEFVDLYHKIRTGYEKIILSSTEMLELQEAEFHLWKVHYMLTDEYRKTIRKLLCKRNDTLSGNVDSGSKTDHVFKRFRSFLSEATDFYGNLIIKIRKSYGLPAEIFLKDWSDSSLNIELTRQNACHYTCHRLLICLGDIARYIEDVKKSNDCDWSTAGKYYIEAARTWPDGGNPHNQLALLATFVADKFLALYHLIRSVEVKEPFPDAWKNLMLILEESSSTPVKELSSQMHIDFSNPSKRISLRDKFPEENHSSRTDEVHNLKNVSELWPILVRTVGFLLTRSSLEGFQCALATALHYLEALLTLDNTELAAALESYKYMGSSRKGPYRALQLVSIFIYIAHSLTKNPKGEDTAENDSSQASFAPLAYAAIFICMGRLTERCTRDIPKNCCPLLPALSVFVEWLVGSIDAAEPHDADERVLNAKSYFIQTLVSLLDCLDQSRIVVASEDTALWEDYELMGFSPLAHLHQNLDFTTRPDCMGDLRSGNEFRFHRIVRAVGKIVDRSKKISSNKARREFISVTEGKEESSLDEGVEHDSGPILEPTLDEEEVILFKPITRRNSAPLYLSKDNSDPLCSKGTKIHITRDDEILRRATSLSIGRSTDVDSFSFCTTTPDPGQNKSGPPSLSAWVLGQEIGREKVQNFNKQKLSPIDEITSTSFSQLSVNESKDSKPLIDNFPASSQSSPPYVTPIPSAPSLPEDASWLSENSSIFPEYKSSTRTEANGILGAAPISSYPNLRPPTGFLPGVSGLVDGYPPFSGMSSSEWLYHYRTSQNVANASNRTSPVPFNDLSYGNVHSNEVTSFDICDQWGNRFVSNPMVYMGRAQQVYPNPSPVYGAQEQNMDRLFLDYQRPFPYVCGAGMELTSDQLPLLQYLKEKEWQMQSGSQIRGPSYMRN